MTWSWYKNVCDVTSRNPKWRIRLVLNGLKRHDADPTLVRKKIKNLTGTRNGRTDGRTDGRKDGRANGGTDVGMACAPNWPTDRPRDSRLFEKNSHSIWNFPSTIPSPDFAPPVPLPNLHVYPCRENLMLTLRVMTNFSPRHHLFSSSYVYSWSHE